MHHQTPLYNQLYEVRCAVQEAFSKENAYIPERSEMLNALQGILETCERGQGAEILEIDFEDLYILYKNRDVMNDAAHIHEAFMGNYELAKMLRQIAKNIEIAQGNCWMPQTTTTH
ncbi:hypothetical protein [Nitrosomonas sp.]|uniref:hypothetical protein n=1 Tax=Nitrosomonas sp. TaxID=42353 RepID=UPI001DB575C8|nr:hypothetical protein [Nitrosomonas sp.]MCB1950148.1 hypothetical protein [Nitrosomonas sp.]